MTTRQLNRLFHQTAGAAGIRKPMTLRTFPARAAAKRQNLILRLLPP
jgi:hypothetical protein